MSEQRYTLRVRLVVGVEDGARVPQNPEAVAEAVKGYLGAHLTPATTAGGYRFLPFETDVESTEEGER